MSTPADWYQDPEGQPGDLRYWDGTQWTDYRQAATTPAPTAPIPPDVAPPRTAPAAPPPLASAPTTPPPPGPPVAKKSKAPLFAVIAIVVVLLIGGGIVTALVIGGSSSSKSPKAYAASFCKKETSEATTLKAAQEAITGNDMTQLSGFLTQTATFLDHTADTMSSLGAPDTPGGKQMFIEMPSSLRTTAKQVRTIAADIKNGDMTSLNEFESLDLASDLGPEASAAWKTVQSEIDASDAPSSCQALNEVFN